MSSIPKKNNRIIKNAKPITYVIVNGKGARKTSIPCVAEIADDREDSPTYEYSTTIQYARGETGIYADKHKPGADKKIITIYFEKDVRVVQPTEKGLIAFLERYPGNVDSPHFNPESKIRIQQYKPEAKVKDTMAKDFAEAEALSLINKLQATKDGYKELSTYAEIIGIDIENDPQVVVFQIAQFAKKDPQAFIDGLNSTSMKKKWWITQALKLGFITIEPISKSVLAQSGQTVFSAEPSTPNDDIIDEFVKYCDGKAGDAIFAAIQKFVDTKLQTK